MSEECPICKQLTNTSFSRLVKDTCGHIKCRMCLLHEEQGCKTCHSEDHISTIGNYDCSSSTNHISNDNSINGKNPVINEEIMLPLELVINKVSKLNENRFEHASMDCIADVELHHDNDSYNNIKDTYKTCTTDTKNNSPSKLYIPKIKPCDMVSDLHTHLNNSNISLVYSQTSYNAAVDTDDPKVKLELTNKEKPLKNKPLKCPDRSHISIIPGIPEKYKCNICCKTFRNKKGKCYHDACITGIRPYQCNFCDRSFVKRSHFEYHERVHRGYKPYKCNLCDKAFPQQNKLNRHMYSHSREKQFICSKCNKGYSKQDDLKNHLNVHNGATTYACKACDKSFKILTNLKRHMRTHTNERPHTCDECSKSFKDKSLLIRHKRTHRKERPFSCAHCSRVFLSKSELRRHLTVHSDEKPFSCEYCQTVFRRKDNLNRHIRHHHSEDALAETNKVQNNVPETSKKLLKTKQNSNLKQRQKQKKIQKNNSNLLSKSPTKVSVVHISSRDQINSRLDSMGNITPVIRTTSEVSNAVPVINGPISIKKLEEKTDTRKKTFTYTEPIPLAEAVVINRRIEEKLYPQNVSNHNYFFRNYTNRIDKQQSIPVSTQPTRTSLCVKSISSTKSNIDSSRSEENTLLPRNFVCSNIELPVHEYVKHSVIETQICEEKTTLCENKNNKILENDPLNNIAVEVININQNDDNTSNQNKCHKMQEQANCVSTIKKHIMQQFQSGCKELINANHTHEAISDNALPKKNVNDTNKKQNNIHWRRRTAETLKPCNQQQTT